MSQAIEREQDLLLDEAEAARILAVSIRTLQAWRVSDVGPPFVRVGRLVRYARSDLLTWIRLRTHRPSNPPQITPRLDQALLLAKAR
jgi:excisionase family DNA binding protein